MYIGEPESEREKKGRDLCLGVQRRCVCKVAVLWSNINMEMGKVASLLEL